MRSGHGVEQLSSGKSPDHGSRSLLLPTTWTVANALLQSRFRATRVIGVFFAYSQVRFGLNAANGATRLERCRFPALEGGTPCVSLSDSCRSFWFSRLRLPAAQRRRPETLTRPRPP